MSCRDCIYWEPIGDANAVMKYKQEHQELPETVFAEFVVEDKDTHFYGRCRYKYEEHKYARIKASETSCGQFATNENSNGV
ncbi:MAG: hypothetical protein IJ564_02955 [Alphaproteobacteria bacterium]|nr:hypothetical protein [Alphaproteobacteria bacterium]